MYSTCCASFVDLIFKEHDCGDRRCMEQNVLELGQQLVSRQNVGDFGLEDNNTLV